VASPGSLTVVNDAGRQLPHTSTRPMQRRAAVAIRQLQKDEWKAYFDRVSKNLLGRRATIEVAALNIGDQIEAEWVPMVGASYDHKDDVLSIAITGLDHMIPNPREIYVDEGETGLTSFEVVDAAGVRHIIQLREPLMLPAPSTAG
jgi:hypothetical protein